MSSQIVYVIYIIRRLFNKDSIRIVREHSFEDALLLASQNYEEFETFPYRYPYSGDIDKENDFTHRFETFRSGFKFFPSNNDRIRVYGAFWEYFYEYFGESFSKAVVRNNRMSHEQLKNRFIIFCRFQGIRLNNNIDKISDEKYRNNAIENIRIPILYYLKDHFRSKAKLWGITDEKKIDLFINSLKPLLEIINPYKETKHIFFPKAGS